MLTISVHASCHIQARDIRGGNALKPDSLPDSGAGSVEDVAKPLGLLALGDALVIRGVKDEDKAVLNVSNDSIA